MMEKFGGVCCRNDITSNTSCMAASHGAIIRQEGACPTSCCWSLVVGISHSAVELLTNDCQLCIKTIIFNVHLDRWQAAGALWHAVLCMCCDELCSHRSLTVWCRLCRGPTAVLCVVNYLFAAGLRNGRWFPRTNARNLDWCSVTTVNSGKWWPC